MPIRCIDTYNSVALTHRYDAYSVKLGLCEKYRPTASLEQSDLSPRSKQKFLGFSHGAECIKLTTRYVFKKA